MMIGRKFNICLRIFFSCLLSYLLLAGMLNHAAAATLQLDSATTQRSLNSEFEVFEDKSARLSIHDVQQATIAGKFKPLAGNLNAAYTRSAYWLRFSLQRSDIRSPQDWWLEMTPVMLDDIRLYETTSDGQLIEHQAGDRHPFSAQEMQHRYPVFRLHLSDTAPQVFYVRIESTSSLFFRAKLWTPQAFAEASNLLSSLMGLFYGLLFAMIAYNLVLMMSFRDKAMLYYLLLSFSILLAGMSVNGHIGLYFARDWPWLVDILPGLTVCFIILWDSLFISHFLHLPKKMPKVSWVFRGIQVFAIATAVIVLAGYNHVVAPLVQLVGFTQVFLILPVCLVSALRGYRPGWIVLIASAAWVAGAMMTSLRNLGVIESSWLSDFGFQIGSALEVILLAVAQTNRINIIKQERALAQKQLLVMAQRAEQELEIKVQQRTTELADAVARLQKLDQEKNDFLGIAAHDLKNPLTSVIGMSDLLRRLDQQMPVAQKHDYLQRISNSGQRMMHIITNLLDVNALETGHSRFNLQAVDLAQVLTEVTQRYQDSLQAKDLQLVLSVEQPVLVKADADAVSQIMDNLLSNAIKYSPLSKQIWIHISSENGAGRFMIKDEGPGLSVDDQQHLFEKFSRLSSKPTAGEHSSGLGLSIVKKLSVAMGGDIDCQSAIGEGCCFTVRLPLIVFREPQTTVTVS
ncbi:signal transduction histidine kinase [Undibacterium sp. GrIS 1.8]